jgi:pantoate--beta-alanine ligase
MRPGHFSGVGLVLARLFHLVQPDKAYFGAKDLQQVALVKTLVRDLEFPLEVVRCTTRREENGLAMSSRNMRLSPDGIQLATHLHKALQLAMGNSKGHINPISSKSAALDYLHKFPGIEIEYLEWVDANSMQIWNEGPEPEEPAVCLAAWVDGVRLIDNLIAE